MPHNAGLFAVCIYGAMRLTGVDSKRAPHRAFHPGRQRSGRGRLEAEQAKQMRRSDPEFTTRSFFRAQDRVFSLNGQWFFATREGEVGPFPTREATLREVARYIEERAALERFQQARRVESEARVLSILPKDDEPAVSLDELILMESQR